MDDDCTDDCMDDCMDDALDLTDWVFRDLPDLLDFMPELIPVLLSVPPRLRDLPALLVRRPPLVERDLVLELERDWEAAEADRDLDILEFVRDPREEEDFLVDRLGARLGNRFGFSPKE